MQTHSFKEIQPELLKLVFSLLIVALATVMLSNLHLNGDIVLILRAYGVNCPTWVATALSVLGAVGAIAKAVAWYLGVTLPAAALAAILFAGTAAS